MLHDPAMTKPQPIKLTVDDYFLLNEAGAFEEYGKVELIDGIIYVVNAQHRPHSWVQTQLLIRLANELKAIGSDLGVLAEAALPVTKHSAPEPDILVTTEPQEEGTVPLGSVRLVVEVADTSLDHDLGRKVSLYAESGVPEYWVVDIREGQIRQMWLPASDGYREQRSVTLDDPITSLAIEGLTIDTSGLRPLS